MLFVLPCNTSNYPQTLFLQSPSFLIKAKYEAPSSVNDTKPVSLVSIVVPLKIVNCVIQAVITVSLEEEWAHLHFQDVFPPTDVWKTSLDFSAYHPFRPSLPLLPTTCPAIQYFFWWFSFFQWKGFFLLTGLMRFLFCSMHAFFILWKMWNYSYNFFFACLKPLIMFLEMGKTVKILL